MQGYEGNKKLSDQGKEQQIQSPQKQQGGKQQQKVQQQSQKPQQQRQGGQQGGQQEQQPIEPQSDAFSESENGPQDEK